MTSVVQRSSRPSGAYQLPVDVMISANYEHRSGNPFARQVLFSGGKQIPTITLNVEPVGTERLPNLNLLDLRLEKRIRLVKGNALAVRVNIFNAANTSTITSLVTRSGATYLQPLAIVPPRTFELSASYTF